jgi:Domain of unknown function (DUF4132)
MPPSSDTPQSLIQLLAADKDPAVANFARSLAGFIETGDPSWVASVTAPPAHGKVGEIGRLAAASLWPWSQEARRIVEFGARLFRTYPATRWPNYHDLFEEVLKAALREERDGRIDAGQWLLELVTELGFSAVELCSAVNSGLYGSIFAAWLRSQEAKAVTLWERHLLTLDEAELVKAVEHAYHGHLLQALATERPAVARSWLREATRKQRLGALRVDRIVALVAGSAEFDDVAIEYMRIAQQPSNRAQVLEALMEKRGDHHRAVLLSAAQAPEVVASRAVLERLCAVEPDCALRVFPAILAGQLHRHHAYQQQSQYDAAFQLAASRLSSAGMMVFDHVILHCDPRAKVSALEALLGKATNENSDVIIEMTRRILASLDGVDAKAAGYSAMRHRRPELFVQEWRELLGSSSKQLREIAVDAWKGCDREQAVMVAREYLAAKKSDQRLGAVALFKHYVSPDAIALLQAALPVEKSAAVRTEISAALESLGWKPAALAQEDRPESLADLQSKLVAQKRAPKPPMAAWLDLAALPGLFAKDGAIVGNAVIAYLFSVQSERKESPDRLNFELRTEDAGDGKLSMFLDRIPQPGQRSIRIAPELLPVFAQIDRSRSGDFSLALLAAWLGSEQETKHRWALTIAGALGDARILSVINSWIQKWCEASRGKLAEYATQAIALQGSDEALMLLDALATRFRSKQRNIGAAAAQAFQAAATARGLSPDELGDVVVPAFGFDADGVRDFTWEGGSARVELGADLKVSWSDTESDKALKGLPASAPDVAKAEVKELGKLLREAAKAQAARLELALVRQRRWPVARWRELYETHPVLRAYATRLVWGVYRGDGKEQALLRCFRRYPNGLLADAAGALEELPEADVLVGMVHPLELSAEAVSAWRAHLTRFKATPPFQQLERPVEQLDPLHANRRELATTKDRALGAGTFRSRAERRGWVRGSVVDAGGVAGYFKAFPGAGVEVSLEINGLYIGVDPMETITLGVARFVRADSVKRGSYTYDDPQAGDARVLAFGEVPPVVYSETVGDLKAITGIVATATDEGDEA